MYFLHQECPTDPGGGLKCHLQALPFFKPLEGWETAKVLTAFLHFLSQVCGSKPYSSIKCSLPARLQGLCISNIW